MTIKDKREAIIFLSKCASQLNQSDSIPEEIVFQLCDWAMKYFEDLKEIPDYIKLYQLLIELSQTIERKEWESRSAVKKKQHQHELQSFVLGNIQNFIEKTHLIVYIRKLSDRKFFNEDHVELYLLEPNNDSPLMKAESDDVFRIYYTGNQQSSKGIERYADVVLSRQDIVRYVMECYPIDLFCYDRLFLSGKLAALKEKNISIWMTGGSLAMCGLLEHLMPRPALNASVNVQDFSYNMVSCQYALEQQPHIDTFIINMPYNYFSWRLSNSTSSFDLSELCRVDFPIFQESQQYSGPLTPIYPKPAVRNAVIHHICDMPVIRERTYRDISKQLSSLTYYNNQFNPRRPTGAMLNYRFQEQTDEYNFYAAKTLAERHYANYNLKFNKKNAALFLTFTRKMLSLGKKIVLYVPPMTNFYRAGVGEDKKTSFYEIVAQLLKEKIVFVDYYDSPDFDNSCFQDYYHLNEKGATILTKKLANLCS